LPDTSEIIKKVKHIEIKTRKLVNEVFSGEYHSVFKGQGIEFAEVRPYQYGDDSRLIDWKVTARQNHPYIKQFTETRELNILIVHDASYSTYFSAKGKKREIAGEIASIITFSALKNNDKSGLILFTDGTEKYIPLEKGKKHSLNIIRHILNYNAKKSKTNLSKAIQEVMSFLKRKTIIFIISDFFVGDFEKELKILSKKHDVIGIKIDDDFEKNIENIGILPVVDIESGEKLFLNTKKSINKYKESYEQHHYRIIETFRKAKADIITLISSEDYFPALYKFFKMREKRLK